MLIKDFHKYVSDIRGVVHVGAHCGEEFDFYARIKNVIWFEPNPEPFAVLKEKTKETDHKCFNIGLHETLQQAPLHVANNGQSSSLLEFGTHSKNHPEIHYIKDISIELTRGDLFFSNNNLTITDYNFLNIDVQGVELSVLKSFGHLLKCFDYIYTEVNTEPVYENCDMLSDIDSYLFQFGFIRKLTKMTRAGWGDALYEKENKSFAALIKKAYSYKPFEYVNNQRWLVCRDLYENNFQNYQKEKTQNIPKIIHQIWLGGQMPGQYQKWAKTWLEFNPDWEYKLWNETNIHEIQFDRNIFSAISNLGQKSDFLRYHVLQQFGGLYVDTDFQCLKSFDDLLYLDLFAGIGFNQNVEVYIGLIGCSKGNEFMKAVCDSMTHTKDNGWRAIFNTTGSYFFTDCFFKNKEKAENAVLFPWQYFYPLPNNLKDEKNYQRYITEQSYAVHHWEVSWRKNK